VKHWTAIVLPLLALPAACGESDVSPGAREPLRLTDTVSPVVRRACETAAERSSLTVACPRVIPAGGDPTVQYVGRIGGKSGPADSYSIHLISASLRRPGSDRENPGHWAVEAARSVSALRKALLRTAQIRPARRALELNGVDLTEYTMPPYPAGGLHGGHLVHLWKGDRGAAPICSASTTRAIAGAPSPWPPRSSQTPPGGGDHPRVVT
jgi:hypothetical protein